MSTDDSAPHIASHSTSHHNIPLHPVICSTMIPHQQEGLSLLYPVSYRNKSADLSLDDVVSIKKREEWSHKESTASSPRKN